MKFSDVEKRIFLAAISRELKVCKTTDKENPYGVDLKSVCNSIEYKVTHSDLWKES